MSAHRDIPCPACSGTGTTSQAVEGQVAQVTCWACWGAGHQQAFLERLAHGDFTPQEHQPVPGG